MSDLAGIITATAGLIVPIGAGVSFVWAKVERRMREIEAKADACEKRESEASEVINKLKFDVWRDGQAVRMLFLELHRLDPHNVTLNNVAVVLRQQFQPDLHLPDDMVDLLARIERGDRRENF